jgi:hypothetical protein
LPEGLQAGSEKKKIVQPQNGKKMTVLFNNKDYLKGRKNGYADALEGYEMSFLPIIDCVYGGRSFDYSAVYYYNAGYEKGYLDGQKALKTDPYLRED